MRFKSRFAIFLVLPLLLAVAAVAPGKDTNTTPWHISGDLSEACTCSVPCTCNFGEKPSPHEFCWALFSMDIQKGSYGKVDLAGLRLAGATAAKGSILYFDDRATPDQSKALQAIAEHTFQTLRSYYEKTAPEALKDPQFTLLGVKPLKIGQEVGPTSNKLTLGDLGGFESDYILGLDGKTPVVVENNWSWNIQHGIKGKTRKLAYKDEYGNAIDLSGTNANQGKFDWSDKTEIYFR
jgi:hypothetical protein